MICESRSNKANVDVKVNVGKVICLKMPQPKKLENCFVFCIQTFTLYFPTATLVLEHMLTYLLET